MRMQEATRDELETGSMMSSTFSLGEPLETASAVSTVDTTDLPAVTDGVRSVRLEDDVATSVNGTTISSAPSSNTVADGPSSQAEDDLLEVRLDQCLFCNIASDDLEGNLNHMQKQHGMFIPEQDFLVDLEGLFSHLHEVIYDLHQCLYCKQVKHTVKGVQTHMRDRGHCMIAYSTEEEMLDIGEYYDFRSTYSDEESEEEDEEESDRQGAGVKLGAKRASKTVIETENGEVDEEMGDADEDGWESDASSLSSVPTDEITAMPIDDHSHRYQTLAQHRHHSHADTRVHRHTDGFHSHAHSTPRAVYHDDYELHLPSGRVAGHRSLNKYYRQNLRNRDEWSEPNRRRLIEAGGDDFEEVSEDEVPTQHSRQRDRGRQLISRAARESALAGISDSKKREIRATEKRTQQKEQRARMKFEWGNERRANHQKHYRVSAVAYLIEASFLTFFSRILYSNR